MSPRRSEVARRMDLHEIRYSMVWEDHALLDAGLQLQGDDRVLAIISAGNNVLSLLLREPESLVAIDMSPAQVALFQLKIAGIRHLDYDDFVTLLGFGPPEERGSSYELVEPHLDQKTRAFWRENRELIDYGIYRCGRLERYFEGFVDQHIADVWEPTLVDRLFDAETLEEQIELFEREAFTPEFQQRFRAYFGQDSMASRGRDPAQFAYVDHDDIGDYFLERFHWVCTAMPLKGNFYVERFLTATHRDLAEGPEYLRREEFERLRGLVDRVEVVNAELEQHLDEVAADTYTKAQLSDVFEYMSVEAADDLFGQLSHGIAEGGRLAYWNLLVPRGRPEMLAHRMRPLDEEATRLWRNDRSWFYRTFRLDEVIA